MNEDHNISFFIIIMGLLVLLCLMLGSGNCQTGAGTLPGPVMGNTVMPSDHPAKAQYKEMATEQNLLPTSGVISYQGERPISDFAYEDKPPVSLGQIAREYREHHPVIRPKITVIP